MGNWKFKKNVALCKENLDDGASQFCESKKTIQFFGGHMKIFKAYIAALVLGCMQFQYAAASAPEAASAQASMINNNSSRHLSWLYQAYTQHSIHPHGKYLIPTIIHFLSLEDSMSENSKKMLASWKKFHPTWEIKVWTENDFACFPFRNKKAFFNANTLQAKADIRRYEILYQFGGLCVDSNFECLQPFDSFNQLSGLYAGVNSSDSALLNNAIIGALPHHPIIALCLNLTNDQENGSALLTRCVTLRSSEFYGKIAPLPAAYFYCPPRKIKHDPQAYAVRNVE
jgi:mannosyltransferase OCH1-like enzyme